METAENIKDKAPDGSQASEAERIEQLKQNPRRDFIQTIRHKDAAFAIIQLPFEKLLITESVRPELPEYAPITESVVCPGCGEVIMSTKVVGSEEKQGLCYMCAGGPCHQVEGRGITTVRRGKGGDQPKGGSNGLPEKGD